MGGCPQSSSDDVERVYLPRKNYLYKERRKEKEKRGKKNKRKRKQRMTTSKIALEAPVYCP